MRMKKIWCAHRVCTMAFVLQMLCCCYVSSANVEPVQSANEKSIESKETSVGFWSMTKQSTKQKQDNENEAELLFILIGLLVLYAGAKVFVSYADDKKSS